MVNRGTLDKVIGLYFACVATEPFTYRGKQYKPRGLTVSPLIFRGFTCPANCGACCGRFSLDYLPEEDLPNIPLQERYIDFNGKKVQVVSDTQEDHENHSCRNLNQENGRCGIHGRQPFSCDFELIRFFEFKNQEKNNSVTQKLYGRGWNMLRIDGKRGSLCEMTEPDQESVKEVVRKFKRLKQWCEHFGLKHRCDEIIDWAERGPWDKPLHLPAEENYISVFYRGNVS